MIKQIKYNRTVGRLEKYLETLTESDWKNDDSVDYTLDKLTLFTVFHKEKKLYLYMITVGDININGLTFNDKVNIIVNWTGLKKKKYIITLL